MSDTTTISNDPNHAKANMDDIYFQPDPRAYFRALGKLGYVIPELARPVFRDLADKIAADRGSPVCALDIGCSYGINAALLKYELSMATLHDHWTDPALANASADAVAEADRALFEKLDASAGLTVIGLDQSAPAVTFGEETGLLDAGLALDLETGPLPPDAAELLSPVDLVMSTGAVGYVGAETFSRLLPALTREDAPWMANFVLRMFDFAPIEAVLADAGYVTEKLADRTFLQRDFVSATEQAAVVEALAERGIDPTGLEGDGQLHAELFVSRPAAEARVPLGELLAA